MSDIEITAVLEEIKKNLIGVVVKVIIGGILCFASVGIAFYYNTSLTLDNHTEEFKDLKVNIKEEFKDVKGDIKEIRQDIRQHEANCKRSDK